MKRILQDMVIGPMISRTKGKRLVGGWALIPNKDLAFIKELIEAGKVRPIIDKHYTFSEVAKAFRYYAEGHSRGKVVVTMGDISNAGER
jgi:NADPH:quinone reductase-like Zn-dependent oxidoreductase